ncbi:MAG: ROK family protein [Bacteroidota bacterium]
MKSVAIDLGGTLIKMALVEENKILDSKTTPSLSQNNFAKNMERVSDHINTLLERNNLTPDQTGGIAIAMPGIVDVHKNRVLSINKKHEDATLFDFNKWAASNWEWPVVIENDARAALVGEWQYGAGAGCDNIVMITLGTGVGGATLINGKLLHGKHYQAGCLGGHFIINYHGNECTCGNLGCVESEASSWKLPELIKGHELHKESKWKNQENFDFENLFTRYRQNDELAIDVANHCMDAWAAGAINLIHAYDPEMVIIGGGVMKSHDLIIPHIKQITQKYAWTPGFKVDIKKAELENSAALIGLNYLLKEKIKN